MKVPTLLSLLEAIGHPPGDQAGEVYIQGIATDSRDVDDGWVFIGI